MWYLVMEWGFEPRLTCLQSHFALRSRKIKTIEGAGTCVDVEEEEEMRLQSGRVYHADGLKQILFVRNWNSSNLIMNTPFLVLC